MCLGSAQASARPPVVIVPVTVVSSLRIWQWWLRPLLGWVSGRMQQVGVPWVSTIRVLHPHAYSWRKESMYPGGAETEPGAWGGPGTRCSPSAVLSPYCLTQAPGCHHPIPHTGTRHSESEASAHIPGVLGGPQCLSLPLLTQAWPMGQTQAHPCPPTASRAADGPMWRLE